MIERVYPGVFLTELPFEAKPIDGVPVSGPLPDATHAGGAAVANPAAPGWTDANAGDPGAAPVDLFAFLGESLAYRGDTESSPRHPDLTRVASRFIGETEKNLDRVLADAPRGGGGGLAFDETAALFGARAGAGAPVVHGAMPKAGGCTVAGAATRSFDVGKTTQAEIDALKASCNRAEQRLGHTIENAKAAYGDLIGRGARILVQANAGNGGQPVMTIVGPGFDPKLPARIHTHYHGDNATVADPVGSKAGQNSRIRATIERDPQTVFVLPEAVPKSGDPIARVDSPTRDGYYKASWAHVRSQAETTDIALRAAGITKIERQTVSVHSRGGEVIQQLMANDPSGRSLRADRLELHDSLYGSQGAVAAWGRTDNGRQVDKVIYVHGTNPGGRDAEIAKVFKGAYIRIDIARQKPLDEQSNPVVYRGADAGRTQAEPGGRGHAPKGQPNVVRQFDPDPHYRTTGQFLAIWPLP